MNQSLKTKRIMKEIFPASGYIISMIINILNYQHWPTISIICGIFLTLIMMLFYIMRVYDQYIVTKRRKELKKTLKIIDDE